MYVPSTIIHGSLYKAFYLRFNWNALFDVDLLQNATLVDAFFCGITDQFMTIHSDSIILMNISNNDIECLLWYSFRHLRNIHIIDVSNNKLVTLGKKCGSKMGLSGKTSILSAISVLLQYNKLTSFNRYDVKQLMHLNNLNIGCNPIAMIDKDLFKFLPELIYVHVPHIYVCWSILNEQVKCNVLNDDIEALSWYKIDIGRTFKIFCNITSSFSLLVVVLVGIYYGSVMHSRFFIDVLFFNHIFVSFVGYAFIIILVNISLNKAFGMLIYDGLRITSILIVQVSYVFTLLRDMALFLKTIFPFRHQCRWLRFVPVICMIIWMIEVANKSVSLVYLLNNGDMIILQDNMFKHHLYVINIVISLFLNTVSIVTTLVCYKIIISVHTSKIRTQSKYKKHVFYYNIVITIILHVPLSSGGGILMILLMIFL